MRHAVIYKRFLGSSSFSKIVFSLTLSSSCLLYLHPNPSHPFQILKTFSHVLVVYFLTFSSFALDGFHHSSLSINPIYLCLTYHSPRLWEPSGGRTCDWRKEEDSCLHAFHTSMKLFHFLKNGIKTFLRCEIRNSALYSFFKPQWNYLHRLYHECLK